MKRKILMNLMMTAAIAAFLAFPALAEWQGEVRTVEGVTVISNPENSAYGEITHEMQELWSRGGDDDEIFFGVVNEFLHDEDGNIFLLDGQLSEIIVFDPEGEYLRSIGREGEGPGEFRNGADMFWAPSGQIGVVQAWPGKIVMVTPDGDPGSTFGLPFRDGGGWQSVTRAAGHDESIILAGTAWTREGEQSVQMTYLKSYDAGGQELATFQETKRATDFQNYEFIEEDYVDFQRRWAVAPDGRVAAALSYLDYEITVWNADGTVDRIIERPEYPAVKRSADEKKRFQTMYTAFTRWNRGSTFRVNEQHQTIGQVFFREDGSLWVQSSQGRWRPDEGVFTTFDVYDPEGRFIQTVHLVADANAVEDGLFFAGDRAYVVTDLFNARMASIGGDGEESDEDDFADVEPVSIISFDFAPLLAMGN